MSGWCRWYRVVKQIRGHSYIYDQATRRENGKTFTRNRYIGPVGGMALRASLSRHHESYARPVVVAAEVQDSVSLAARNRAVLARLPANHLNFNLQAFERSATAIGVDLERELERVDGEPTMEKKIEAMHRLWGLLHVEDRFAAVRSHLAHVRDAPAGEDNEAVGRLDALLEEGRALDATTLQEELEDIALNAEYPFVRREVGEIVERLLPQSRKDQSLGDILKAGQMILEQRLFADTLRKFARHQGDVERWRGWDVPIGDGLSLRAGDIVDVSGVLFQITNVLDIGAGRTYQVECGQDCTWQFVSATTLEAAGRLGIPGLEGQ